MLLLRAVANIYANFVGNFVQTELLMHKRCA